MLCEASTRCNFAHIQLLAHMDFEFQKEWRETLALLESRFGGDMDLDAVLYLIGLQELGKGFQTFSKDEKVNIMHIAVCTLLVPYGYYEYEGEDSEGWPHYKRLKKLPHLKSEEQDRLMKEAVINYIRKQPLSS